MIFYLILKFTHDFIVVINRLSFISITFEFLEKVTDQHITILFYLASLEK